MRDRREQLLRNAEIDPAIIEREYLDAKARVRATWAAGEAWDERAGLAVKREELDRVTEAEDECAGRLSRMKADNRSRRCGVDPICYR
ncbi:hypothetical protein [Bradyrhizobium sp. 2S1]|uniref:hypothetical protein n=1 Tax=Bradyrhizobium sp. 2S1 TaxID=1404429 RepID=UPI00140C5F26|nr:hypothetical protein [Bradyrhizobium sp. 2S1]MCK7667833.1 hypothetical protein [Bradyrhizobium sp. 2S1]